MNAKQRWANRLTAQNARYLLHGASVRFTAMASGRSMVVISSSNLRRGLPPRPSMVCFDDVEDAPILPLADLTDGASRILFGIDPEQEPPVLVEGESDLTNVLGHVWVSTSVLSPIRYLDAPAKEPT